MTTPVLQRETGIDALKVAVTALVVLHHTAITYGAIGGWYYKEVLPGKDPAALLLVLFCTVNQAWFMGLFFLLAARQVPGSLARRGRRDYVAERLLRLGLPWLLYGFTVGPVTLALARTAGGDDFISTLRVLFSLGAFVNGPTWFASALLVFSLLAVPWLQRRASPPAVARPFPGNRALLLAALGCAVASFALRLVWPVGTDVGGWQLGYFPGYVLLFVFGLQWAHGGATLPPPPQRRLWRRVTWLALPMLLPLAFLAKRFPVFAGDARGGFNLPAVMYALWEPFVAWGVLMALLAWAARTRLGAGPLAQTLARRAFAVYVMHPLVVVGVCLAWREVAAPALLKFVVSGSVACVLSWLLAGLLLRLPPLRRVL